MTKRPDHPDTDPLDDLKLAFSSTTPTPDPIEKAAALARAQEIFDRSQGSVDDARPTSDHPKKRMDLITGVRHMFAAITSRPALTATTALVAVGLVALVPVLRDGPPALPGFTQSETGSAAPDPALTAPDQRTDTEIVVGEPMVMEEPAVEIDLLSKIAPPPAPSAMPTNRAVTGRVRESYSAPMSDALGGIVAPSPVPDTIAPPRQPDTEEFANAEANPVKSVDTDPVSTFSIDVDTASYSVIRSSLMNGQLPPKDAVRIEEMVNYFPYAYPGPDADEGPFKPTVTVSGTPWNADTHLMQIAVQGELPAIADRPALNLVFLIDTSGSMNQPDKLPLLKQSFRLMLAQLRPEDQVAIVAYAGSAGQVLEPTAAGDRTKILAALDRLDAGGSTAGQAGLQQAYATAEAMTKDGEVSRVILATDGDFNVGLSNPDALKDYIADKRDSGTYLSVLGFGRGNLDDATMQALAQNGNGTAAYIDTLSEAQKVLVDQLTGALFPIANDVKIQVEFNPATVAEYRLIGYETRALKREDFNNDKVDAGEIGAGHSVTAIYEVTPVGSSAILNDPLRYGAGDSTQAGNGDELAFLRLRYKAPGEDTSKLIEMPITPDMGAATEDSRFAAAIAGFGQLLRDGVYTGDWGYSDAIALAQDNIGDDPFGYRREAVTLMRLANSLSE